MNVFYIMLKEIKTILRSKSTVVMLILLPIMLMAILGFALSGTFDGTSDFGEVDIAYCCNDQGAMSQAFDKFIKSQENANIKFIEEPNINKGINAVKNAQYTTFLVIGQDNLVLYKNSIDNTYSQIAQAILSAFVDSYNTKSAIAMNNPAALESITSDPNYDFVDTVSLNKKKQPSSIDYYAVSMLTLIIMYSSITAATAISSERNRKTGTRMLTAPVKKYEILLAKFLGIIVAALVQSLIVFIFSKYILGAYWGNDIISTFAIITSEISFASALGVSVGFIVKNINAAEGLLQSFIPFIAFLGGAYVPLSIMNSNAIMQLSNISPLKWTNNAIFQIAFANDYSTMPKALAINLILAAGLIFISAHMFKKEAF